MSECSVLGAGFGQQVQALFNKDLAASDVVVLEQWERHALHQHFKEMIARMWVYRL